jgi:hypothetical protein
MLWNLAIAIAAFGGIMLLRHCSAIAILGAMGLAVSACASVIEGTTQQIVVNTNPPGADCGLYREEGIRIAAIQKTPGRALIEKTKNDIWIVCVKQGYQQAIYLNRSGVAGAVFVNVIGGVFTLGISTVIGAAVDSSNGAANKYDSSVNVSMVANSSDLPEGPSVLPQSFSAPKPAQNGLQQAAPPPAVEPTTGETNNGQVAAAMPATSRPPSAPPSTGVWACGINNPANSSNPHYTLRFVIGADHTITAVNYANAQAAIVNSDPLTFTAINPRGSRLTTFTWKPDNSMTITGPGLNNPNSRFHNEGTCTKEA